MRRLGLRRALLLLVAVVSAYLLLTSSLPSRQSESLVVVSELAASPWPLHKAKPLASMSSAPSPKRPFGASHQPILPLPELNGTTLQLQVISTKVSRKDPRGYAGHAGKEEADAKSALDVRNGTESRPKKPKPLSIIEVCVIAYCSAHEVEESTVLQQTLTSLNGAQYDSDRYDIRLRVVVDQGKLRCIDVVNDWHWKHGIKIMSYLPPAPTPATVVDYWRECLNVTSTLDSQANAIAPTNATKLIAIIESSLKLSSYYYSWLKVAWKAYSTDERVLGFSLNRQFLDPYDTISESRPHNVKLPQKRVDNGYIPYLSSNPGFRGAVLLTRFAHAIRNYVTMQLSTQLPPDSPELSNCPWYVSFNVTKFDHEVVSHHGCGWPDQFNKSSTAALQILKSYWMPWLAAYMSRYSLSLVHANFRDTSMSLVANTDGNAAINVISELCQHQNNSGTRAKLRIDAHPLTLVNISNFAPEMLYTNSRRLLRYDWVGRLIPSCNQLGCKNGAVCTDVSNGVHCRCSQGYTGLLCEQPVRHASADSIAISILVSSGDAKGLLSLLRSLNVADYEDDVVSLNIIINAARTPGEIHLVEAVIEVAGEISWIHGNKVITRLERYHSKLEMWLRVEPITSIYQQPMLILESDVIVAPLFYRFLKMAYIVHQHRVNVAGISLGHAPFLNDHPFNSPWSNTSATDFDGLLLDADVSTQNVPYLTIHPGSRAYMPFPSAWTPFKDWLHNILALNQANPAESYTTQVAMLEQIQSLTTISWFSNLIRDNLRSIQEARMADNLLEIKTHLREHWTPWWILFCESNAKFSLYTKFRDPAQVLAVSLQGDGDLWSVERIKSAHKLSGAQSKITTRFVSKPELIRDQLPTKAPLTIFDVHGMRINDCDTAITRKECRPDRYACRPAFQGHRDVICLELDLRVDGNSFEVEVIEAAHPDSMYKEDNRQPKDSRDELENTSEEAIIPTKLSHLSLAAQNLAFDRPVNKLDGQPGMASRKTVILVTVNTGYIDFFKNWLLYAKKHGFVRYIVIAEDQNAFDVLTSDSRLDLEGKVLFSTNTELSSDVQASAVRKHGLNQDMALDEPFSYQSQGYNIIVSRRPRYLHFLLQLGYDVLYCDVDSVWLANPFTHLTNQSYSLHIQSDPEDETFPADHMLCTGFMLLRSSNVTMNLMLDWERAIEAATVGSSVNQYHFNTVIKKYIQQGQQDGSFLVNILPYQYFPSGSLYFNDDWRNRQSHPPAVVHANFIVGHANKLEYMISTGLWQAVG